MNKSKIVKNAAVLISPLLSFAVLLVPYSWANQAFIVDWFGCGCPKVDELGNIIHPDFNANDFTALFWLFSQMLPRRGGGSCWQRNPKILFLRAGAVHR